MKKILAIAVATAIAAPAMADMTISGTVAAGYSSTTKDSAATYKLDTTASTAAAIVDKAATTASGGFGIDTAAIKISGSETLENGLTVAGSMSAGGFTRGSSVGGEDAGLSVSGDFGKVGISAVKVAGDYIVALGGADNFAGEFTGEATIDSITYTAPAFGAATVSVGFSDAIGIGTDNGDVDPYVNAEIDLGDLDVHARYRTFAKNTDGTNSQIQLGATYNAGAVVVGAGYQSTDANTDATVSSVSLSLPMGATTLGASVVSKKADGSASQTGTSVAAKYALSSNVAASVKYNSWDASASATSEKVQSLSALVSISF